MLQGRTHREIDAHCMLHVSGCACCACCGSGGQLSAGTNAPHSRRACFRGVLVNNAVTCVHVRVPQGKSQDYRTVFEKTKTIGSFAFNVLIPAIVSYEHTIIGVAVISPTMHGATQGQGMRMSLAPASTTSLVNPAHRSSSANLHISTSSALVPRRTPLQQQPAQQPIVVVQAAKTTTHQVETKDAAPKKKRAPRKKKGPSDDDAPKQRKAARSIKRTDADAAFLQLLPEDNLEQLQDQLQDEMEAMVERKGGGLLTRTKKKTVPSTVAPVEDAVMDAAETPATPPVAAEYVWHMLP